MQPRSGAGSITIQVWVGTCKSKDSYSQNMSGTEICFIPINLGKDSNMLLWKRVHAFMEKEW